MNAIDKLDEALAETPKVRKDLGYPPLVTPTSQMVGSQAVQNVLAGERYKVVGKEIKAYCRGEYGRTPAPIDPEIQKKILGDTPLVEGRYADTLEPVFEKTKAELGATAKSDEDVLSYIAFPQVAMAFFKDREAGFPKKEEPKKAAAPAAAKAPELPPLPAWQGPCVLHRRVRSRGPWLYCPPHRALRCFLSAPPPGNGRSGRRLHRNLYHHHRRQALPGGR